MREGYRLINYIKERVWVMEFSQRAVSNLLVFTVLLLWSQAAHASGTGMPWEGPLEQIMDSLTGPVAKIIGTLAILGSGIGVAFSEGGSSVRKFVYVLFGLSIAFTAASFFLPLFGFAGGATF